MNLKVTLFLCFALSAGVVRGQVSLNQIDYSHKYLLDKDYDVKAIGMKEGDRITLFAAYKIPDTLKSLPVSFWGANTYKDPVTRIDSLINLENYLGFKDNHHYYQYQFDTDFEIVAIEIVTGETTSDIHEVQLNDQQYDVWLNDAETGLPLLSRWLRNGNQYFTEDLDPATLEQYVSFYSFEFDAATPPMSRKEVESKEIKPDSMYIAFESDPLSFNKEGYYLFQNDTASSRGYGWINTYDAYPKLNKIEHLVPPLLYITTPDEYSRLTSAMDKQSFDKFWLKIGKNSSAARNMIKQYYDRVEAANRFFTTYKEGWKTDMGMVYIIFGPPDQVLIGNDGETWYYGNDDDPIIFRFAKFSHVFYPHNYVLMRGDNYKQVWFRAVDMLRNNYF